MKTMIKAGVFLFIAFVGFIYLSTPDFIISTPSKVWRRAGGDNQNEIVSVMKTIDSGQTGIQLDFALKKGRLFLYKEAEVDEKTVVNLDESASELFTTLEGKSFNLWMTLKDVSLAQIMEISGILKEKYLKHRLFGKAFVETESMLFSMVLRLRGVPVVYLYDIKKSSIRNLVNKVFIMPLQLIFKIPSISYNVKNLKASGLRKYSGDRMLFTLEEDEIKDHYCNDSVKVILTDLSKEEVDEVIPDCSILRE